MDLTHPQIAWINTQVAIDAEEQFEESVSLAEYVGMFMNADAVRQVRQIRENQKAMRDEKTEEFNESIKETFGRGLDDIEKTEFKPSNEKVTNKMEGVTNKELSEIRVIRKKRDFRPSE